MFMVYVMLFQFDAFFNLMRFLLLLSVMGEAIFNLLF